MYDHCDECEEHDDLMRSRDRATLRIEDVTDLAWTPLAFLTPEGYRYYMPALIRLALSAEGEDLLAYLVRDLGAPIRRESPPSHLPRTALFSPPETRAVLAFLRYVRDHERETLKECDDTSHKVLARAISNWEHFVTCRGAGSPSGSE